MKKTKRYENRFAWESNDQPMSDPGTLKQVMKEIEYSIEQSSEENVVVFELVPRFTIVEKKQLIQKKFSRES